jgi:formamidopyrimidine-DNA glycosylase
VGGIELPEIETLRRDLEREAVGKKIKSVELTSLAMTPRVKTRKAFIGPLEGRKITGVKRIGLVLVLELDADVMVAVRFGPGTRLLRAQSKDAAPDGTEVVVTFSQGGQLRVVDPGPDRGELVLSPPDGLVELLPELGALGIDPIEEPMSWTRFGELLIVKRMPLKTLLTDPSIIVGIGDVYADEILFAAGLRYDRASDSLSTQEIRRLYRSLVETIHDAVKHRGTSARERGWSDLFGRPGGYDEYLAVYGREGELSPRSRTPIRKAKFNGRWTYYCDTQT